ncbi:ScbR family autoregulator-binding transcription factor [Rhodococcus artemisiae]|uniref:ScbR family autoregulator-binding transcription factor n=1 Tax=Rhodococcus artemisiae TaxID=714159 RepID=A0ABU7LDP1_9NOCA|nr:ScbR family autoregulator-binding transcription factor [Rhodococcus artemisiae]MEE2059671.1 ScbR family autoregulator-binding transcription factor [Rhodococcus artemisiae]
MARQVRAEVTREAVLGGAAEVFVRLGYANASLNEIIDEAGVTKGALYFHFGSKEELARGVIDAGCERFAVAARSKMEQRAPALETAIEVSVLNASMSESDRIVRAMFRLLVEIGDYHGNEVAPFGSWFDSMLDLMQRAHDEGDLEPSIDVEGLAYFLLQSLIGARTVSAALDRTEQLTEQIESMWSILLPALVPADKLGYFLQFVSRRLRVS